MVEFISKFFKWIVITLIIFLVVFFIYNVSRVSNKQTSNNTTSAPTSSIKKKTKTNTDSQTSDLEEITENSSSSDTTDLEEIDAPDTASFGSISIFLGVFILGGATCYIYHRRQFDY